jgi:hypothetical protein
MRTLSPIEQRRRDWEVLHEAGQLLLDLGQDRLGRQVMIAAGDASSGRITRKGS